MFLGKSIKGVEISAILPLFICRYTMCCTIIQDKIEVLLQTVYNIVKKKKKLKSTVLDISSSSSSLNK